LDSNNLLNYDAASCPIYSRSATQLTLFSAFTISSDGTAQVALENNKFDCFKAVDTAAANTILSKLTGLTVNPTAPIAVANLQIFHLSLD
jgi:hypothetical protein